MKKLEQSWKNSNLSFLIWYKTYVFDERNQRKVFSARKKFTKQLGLIEIRDQFERLVHNKLRKNSYEAPEMQEVHLGRDDRRLTKPGFTVESGEIEQGRRRELEGAVGKQNMSQ